MEIGSAAGGYREMSSILADQLAPTYMSPNAGGVEGSVHRNPNKLWRITPYLTYSLLEFKIRPVFLSKNVVTKKKKMN
jgi:hypothetical protein